MRAVVEILTSWPVLLALAVVWHEAGHAAVADALGLRWRTFARFPWAAGIAVHAPPGGLKPGNDLLIALAGPTASLTLAVAAAPVLPLLAAFSALLGVLNLLPFLPGSDGWRATQAIRAALGERAAA